MFPALGSPEHSGRVGVRNGSEGSASFIRPWGEQGVVRPEHCAGMRMAAANDTQGRNTGGFPHAILVGADDEFAGKRVEANDSNVSAGARHGLNWLPAEIPGLQSETVVRQSRCQHIALSSGQERQVANGVHLRLKIEALPPAVEAESTDFSERISRHEHVTAGLEAKLFKIVLRQFHDRCPIGSLYEPKLLVPGVTDDFLSIRSEARRVVRVIVLPSAGSLRDVPHRQVFLVRADLE